MPGANYVMNCDLVFNFDIYTNKLTLRDIQHKNS